MHSEPDPSAPTLPPLPAGDETLEAAFDPNATAAGPASMPIADASLGASPHPVALGPYRILRVLGSGGMGIVYLAEQTEPVRRRVAIKVIRAGMADAEILARFRAEQQAMAVMNHPSIAGEYEFGTTRDGSPYFVMEYVSGAPITKFSDDNNLGVDERLDLFMQVCDAIQHAHHKGIIHRDIKPSNVLVTELDGKPLPKVIDFGIAKAFGDEMQGEARSTQHGTIVGTPEYMSPEQADTSSVDIDTRTDIYSLGVLLYELLVGALPFGSEELRSQGLLALHRTILEKEPQRPSTRLRELQVAESDTVVRSRKTDRKSLTRRLDGDLDWIILKCLEKERARRYSSASDLAADIRRHLGHVPVTAGPPSLAYRARKFVRRHRVPLGFAAVALLLLAVTGVILELVAISRFHEELRALDQAVEQGDLRSARSTLGLLEGSFGKRPEIAAAAQRVADLETWIKVQSSKSFESQSQEHWKSFLGLKSSKESLEQSWKVAARELESWQPVWERTSELDAWHRLAGIDEEISESYNKTLFSLFRGVEEAPPGSEQLRSVQSALERVYWESYREAWSKGSLSLPPSYFKGLVDSLGLGTYEQPLAETIRFTSDPPGAEIYCFRYVAVEERLLPLPFDPAKGVDVPARGLLAEDFLEVEQVADPGESPFRPGDRIVEVGGVKVRRRGELARALESVAADASVEVRVTRAGEAVTLSWVPFPSALYVTLGAHQDSPLRPGRLVDIYVQLGLVFAGYPLDFSRAAPLGTTADGRPVEVDLAKGSYLFVLRKEGRVDTRVPVAITARQHAFHVKLLEPGEIPPGFVHVPAGQVLVGGDAESYNGLEEIAADVPDFLIGRLEVTIADYLAFLNDAEVSPRIDAAGELEPRADWDAPEIKVFLTPELAARKRLKVLPVYQEKPFVALEGGEWKSRLPEDWPLFGISVPAGLEYADWRTRKCGGRWRFRLPGDLEWEKAARGADKRAFVWGDYLLWTFFRSQKGSCPGRPRKSIDRVGIHSSDESVYGIRDLAGSMKEPVGEVDREFRLSILRGGEWNTVDHRDFRVATRNRRRPEYSFAFVGLRLAADLAGLAADPPGR